VAQRPLDRRRPHSLCRGVAADSREKRIEVAFEGGSRAFRQTRRGEQRNREDDPTADTRRRHYRDSLMLHSSRGPLPRAGRSPNAPRRLPQIASHSPLLRGLRSKLCLESPPRSELNFPCPSLSQGLSLPSWYAREDEMGQVLGLGVTHFPPLSGTDESM